MKKSIAIWHGEHRTLYYGIVCFPDKDDMWEIVQSFDTINDAEIWLKQGE